MAWTPQTVEAQLQQAWDALRALPDHEVKWLYHADASAWPDVLREATEAYGYDEETETLDPATIDSILPVLGWLSWLSWGQRKLVISRLKGQHWKGSDIRYKSALRLIRTKLLTGRFKKV